jgi:peptidylprolyl isomerase
LFEDDAPLSVKRIRELVHSGFYDGLLLHRAVPGYFIQGGDPNSNGTGGSGQAIPAEFNSREHVEGTMGLAHDFDSDTGDSQFYFTLARVPAWDGEFTVIGQVRSGLEVLRKLSYGDRTVSVTLKSE